jgi:hypothetical protein
MREYEEQIKIVLTEFFTLTDDGWVNQRADQEIQQYRAKIEQASRAGKASAERRFNAGSTDVQPTINHKPITNNQIDIDRFELFWKQYPRKIAKPNALKAWLKIKPNDTLSQKMIDAVKQQKLSDREIQFVPHPATWLNGNRWEDEISAPTTNVMTLGRRVL